MGQSDWFRKGRRTWMAAVWKELNIIAKTACLMNVKLGLVGQFVVVELQRVRSAQFRETVPQTGELEGSRRYGQLSQEDREIPGTNVALLGQS
jgi:hypothetical protein